MTSIVRCLLALMLAVFFNNNAVADDVKELYKTKCNACHGADGRGDTAAGKKFSAHDFHSADAQKLTDQELMDRIKNGKNKMPAYKSKLTDEQIKDLVKYVRELGKSAK